MSCCRPWPKLRLLPSSSPWLSRYITPLQEPVFCPTLQEHVYITPFKLAQQVHHTSSRTCQMSHPSRTGVHHTLPELLYYPRQLSVLVTLSFKEVLATERAKLARSFTPLLHRLLWLNSLLQSGCACCKHYYDVECEGCSSIRLP